MGVFSPKVSFFFLNKKVFDFYARPLDADLLAYYWCVAPGLWCRCSKRKYTLPFTLHHIFTLSLMLDSQTVL